MNAETIVDLILKIIAAITGIITVVISIIQIKNIKEGRTPPIDKSIRRERIRQKQTYIPIFILGAVFMLLSFGMAVYIVVEEKDVPSFAMFIFRVILAISSGGVVAALPNFLTFEVKSSLKASGSLLIFAIVYLVNPPGYVQKQVLEITKITQNTQISPSTDTSSPTSSLSSSEKQYFENLKYANTIATAVEPLKKNSFIGTLYDGKKDTYYKINLKKGDGIVVVLKHMENATLYMYLLDENENKLPDDLSSATSTNLSIDHGKYRSYEYTAPQNRTIYVKITPGYLFTGEYLIGFYDKYGENKRDFYGSLGTSKKISEGSFERKEDSLDDWYMVEVNEGKTLTVNVKAQIDKNYMSIDLVDQTGTVLVSKSPIKDGQTGELLKKASVNSKYFIRIYDQFGRYYLTYSIQ